MIGSVWQRRMSSFTTSTEKGNADSASIERGKEDVAKRLEAAVKTKAEENLALYQELLRKQALLEEAEAVFDEANELIEQHNLSRQVAVRNESNEVARVNAEESQESQAESIAECIGEKLAPYNPTNTEACDIALDMLDLKDDDILYDLGCGDARLLVQAWGRLKKQSESDEIKSSDGDFKFRTVGIEYDSLLHRRGQENLEANDLVPPQASVIHGNVLDADYSDATALFVYLVPAGMKALRDTLVALMTENKEVRVVTYVFSIPNLEPKQVSVYKQSTKLYLYDHTCIY